MNDLQNIRIRFLKEEDAPAAAYIEQNCFSQPWSEEIYRSTLALPFALYAAAENEEGRLIGICGVRMIAGEGDISNVALLPQYRGRRISEKMLEFLLKEAEKRGTEAFTLEVRAGNAPALALYKHFGFKTEGIRKNFYEKPVEDALILWRRKGTDD